MVDAYSYNSPNSIDISLSIMPTCCAVSEAEKFLNFISILNLSLYKQHIKVQWKAYAHAYLSSGNTITRHLYD